MAKQKQKLGWMRREGRRGEEKEEMGDGRRTNEKRGRRKKNRKRWEDKGRREKQKGG